MNRYYLNSILILTIFLTTLCVRIAVCDSFCLLVLNITIGVCFIVVFIVAIRETIRMKKAKQKDKTKQ